MMSAKKRSHAKKGPKPFRWRHFFKVSLIYIILFLAIFGMIDYYAMMEFNFLWFATVSVVLGVVIGYYHVRRGRRDHVDEVAEELL